MKDGKRHGFGIETESGSRYEGQFEEDKKHGRGSLYTSKGEVISGSWSKGLLEGSAVFKSTQGIETKVEFKNGLF